MPNATLLLGSNLGDRHAFLAAARAAIGETAGEIVLHTHEMRTEPWGYESPNFYLNQIVVVRTFLEPLDLLDMLQNIERQLGRTRVVDGSYADRTIDIDILYYDDLIFCNERLEIPHPRIHERPFVLHLLSCVAPVAPATPIFVASATPIF